MTQPTSPPAGRYGPPPRPGHHRRAVAALTALGVLGTAVVVWVGIGLARTPVTWQDVGFTLADDQVEVVYEVTRLEPGTEVRCTVEALNSAFAQVGVVEVVVPPADTRTVRLANAVRTSEPAVTGVVRDCWVP
ncbi:DUF4307 domain-containing protein [Cellulomonas bogoriensis]|uniref:DUF4307 domain-containing protein n=1 Tax=Cellulomonas bogoriensis 69B4 = DSM 16987 TaxID=1386082 RepID=A0A0A0BTF4_9CELL|nr:DUF4307 domain-containing protein [Cellulomonas bogoriensis]KGM10977.1 hypothetical protein N869_04025 [Cellulomonas bogoriensis 69B4 = DSM 16987]